MTSCTSGEYDNTYVRISVLVETPPTHISKKEQLLAVFKKMQQHNLFANIENHVLWQKQLREEWQ